MNIDRQMPTAAMLLKNGSMSIVGVEQIYKA